MIPQKPKSTSVAASRFATQGKSSLAVSSLAVPTKSTSAAGPPVVFVGIDWADREHEVALLTPDGTLLRETFAQDPVAIRDWVASLATRFPGHRMVVALEQSRGALFAALTPHELLELYPINPDQLANYRKALSPSRAKSDPGDAELLARFVANHHLQLRRWQPDEAATAKLRELTQLRRQLVEMRKGLLNKLKSNLKLYFPLALTCGKDLNTPLILDLLRRWPHLRELQRVHPKTLRRFLHEHGRRNEDQQSEFINNARAAVPLTTDDAIVGPRSLLVQGLVQQIRDLNDTIATFDEELKTATATHPDQPLYRALPGAGDVLVPRLIAALGSDRERFQSSDEVERCTGIAPITQASGQSKHVVKRTACSKFLRQTFHEFADQARKWSPWSTAYYDMRRAQGTKHHAAVRALAYKWIRIIFRLWKTNTIYNEATYQTQLRKTNSPLLKYLPS